MPIAIGEKGSIDWAIPVSLLLARFAIILDLSVLIIIVTSCRNLDKSYELDYKKTGVKENL